MGCLILETLGMGANETRSGRVHLEVIDPRRQLPASLVEGSIRQNLNSSFGQGL